MYIKKSLRYLAIGGLALSAAEMQRPSVLADAPKPVAISSHAEAPTLGQVKPQKVNDVGAIALNSDNTGAENDLRAESDGNTEVIRERFPSGKVRIERHVVLDDNGNYVNHGDYQEMNAAGNLICSGHYTLGAKQGVWMRICQSNESPLFQVYPYSKLKPPFKSTVEFDAGKMHGVWLISDAENRVACQIPLENGYRHGQATFFHPSREIQFQADYRSGILDGIYIEKDPTGKIVRQDTYTDGQKTEIERESFPTTLLNGQSSRKQLKTEYQYLTPTQKLLELDNWETSRLATYRTHGERIKHGPFISYYENGQTKSKGTYELGVLIGDFESWYSNGQFEATGAYEQGVQVGRWTWWHVNGMRRALATYENGQLTGTLQAWHEDGRRNTASAQPNQSPSREVKTQTPVSPRNTH